MNESYVCESESPESVRSRMFNIAVGKAQVPAQPGVAPFERTRTLKHTQSYSSTITEINRKCFNPKTTGADRLK